MAEAYNRWKLNKMSGWCMWHYKKDPCSICKKNWGKQKELLKPVSKGWGYE